MIYSAKVIKHFKNPQNQGILEKPDGIGEVGNPTCGDVMRIYIKVHENQAQEKIIEDIKFETLGCAAAIATSSIITEMAKGKSFQQALEIDKDTVVQSLGGLPKIKIHCSLLAVDALKQAIKDYEGKNKKCQV